jgi:hypothetical protein
MRGVLVWGPQAVGVVLGGEYQGSPLPHGPEVGPAPWGVVYGLPMSVVATVPCGRDVAL